MSINDEEMKHRQRSSEGHTIEYCQERYGSNLSNGEYAFSFESFDSEQIYWLTYKEDENDHINYLYVTENAPTLDMTNYLDYIWEYKKDKNEMYLKNLGNGQYLKMKDSTSLSSPMILTSDKSERHYTYLNNGIKLINQQNPSLYANIGDKRVYGDNVQSINRCGIIKYYTVLGGGLPEYEGSYTVISSIQEDKTMNVKDTSMTSNITIVKNETSESLTKGTTGYTFTIY